MGREKIASIQLLTAWRWTSHLSFLSFLFLFISFSNTCCRTINEREGRRLNEREDKSKRRARVFIAEFLRFVTCTKPTTNNQTIPFHCEMCQRDCGECEQSGMDESHTNALWPNSQQCVACCTPNLSPFTAHRQVQVRRKDHSGSCALWVQICETTVGDFRASKRTFCESICSTNTTSISWRNTVPAKIQKKERRMVRHGS